MAPYTLINLQQIEDSAPKFGLAPNLAARFASGDLGLERLGLSHQRLAPNTSGPFGHRHKTQEEVYVVLSGGGRARVGEDYLDLQPYDALRVEAEAARAFEAGSEGLELLAIGAPAVENLAEEAEVLPDFRAG
jgi:uncharacterized cupin superfamily protein